ncbi:CheR methyltransferase, SAM binding domain protein [Candidatus Moduliflexus flocculans]|uniref:CheR methyltransferase, SAM binding domain protein n=1 Tax=Candidatus Moduliflexus flocculans TaxID=1499966 RepID=A0A0S6W0W6_9BACT|nr:CheR methyltransferase, SAM binding domain protein [Candidatus Moduliflexus flocculans]
MDLRIIEKWLEERIGLSTETIGTEAVAKVVQARMQACGLADTDAYAAYLLRSEAEREELIESVIIPETWFFRNHRSFQFLQQYVKTEWLPARGHRVLRALSLPCSTGEEPYSMAMMLLDAGLSEQAIHVDAIDVSEKSLQKARNGVYGAESFRRKDADAAFRQRFFEPVSDKFHICSAVRQIVHFQQGNLLDAARFAKKDPYDIIFCRNVLIYLGEAAKKQTVKLLEKLLSANGIIFVGHAERPAFAGAPFEWIQETGVFACRRAAALQPSSAKTARKINSSPIKTPVAAVPPLKPALPLEPIFERRQRQQTPARPTKEGVTHSQVVEPIAQTEAANNERRHTVDMMTQTLDQARSLADQGQLAAALDVCDTVLKTDAVHVQAHFLKGLIYQALRDERRAEEWLNKTVYLDPNHEDALSYLAALAEFQGDFGKAARLRQRIERIRKKS